MSVFCFFVGKGKFNLRNVCRVVVITRLERLGPNDIAYAIGGEHERSSQLLLRVSGNVAADHRQAHAEAQTLEVTQPKPDQATPLVALWQTNKHCSASDANHVGDDHRRATSVGPLAADEATAEESGELDEPTGDL